MKEGMVLAEKKLNDFVAHELRSPLFTVTSAISFVVENLATIKEQVDAKDYQELSVDLHTVQSSLSFITQLVHSTLDLEKCLAGEIVLNESASKVRQDILLDVQSILRMRKSSVPIVVECEKEIVFVVDSLRLKQIIMNLAGNAVKFTKQGYVMLTSRVIDQGKWVLLTVEDTGSGISEERQQSLFDRWTDLKDEGQGNGIGLHLCKILSNLMGGYLYFDKEYTPSAPFKSGSRFCLKLPFKLAPQETVATGLELCGVTSLSERILETSES